MLNALNETVSEITCLDKQQIIEFQNSIHQKLKLVYHKQDSTHSKLDSFTATTAQLSSDHQQIQDNISDVECLELNQNLHTNNTHHLEKIKYDVTYIHGELSYTCGGTRGWRRVLYLDMTDASTTCPSGWELTGYSKRTCGRATDGTNTCDSATYIFHPNDTLWDGEDCLPNSTCCSRRNPPYFVKQLSNSTTDDIEARICLDDSKSRENIAVELVEFYVQ